MPHYRYTIVIDNAGHWDRPVDPLRFEFDAPGDTEAQAIASARLAEVRSFPAVEGIHAEKLQEGSVAPSGLFLPARLVCFVHEDDTCGDVFCVGFSSRAALEKRFG